MYVPVSVESVGDQRIVEAAATFRAGVVTGWAALRWLGTRWFDGADRPVPLALQGNEGSSAHPELVDITQEFLHPAEVVRVDGLRLTSTVRSVAFEMRHARSTLEAAEVFAMAAYDDLVSIQEISDYCALHLPRCTGVGKVRAALPRLTENAWSPTEVAMVWVWQEAVEDAVVRHNCPLFDEAGRHLATVDAIDLEAGVVGEYYGALHLAGQQRTEDVVREEVLRAAGLEVVVMLAPDLSNPSGFTGRLEAAYQRARGWTRLWTATPPDWWTDTSSVAARRALTGVRRERLLAYRRAA